jgi:hypothetical protein
LRFVVNRFWTFLQQEQNRQVIGWIGGGLVVAATGAWAAFVYFFPAHKTPEPQPAKVEASCGGIAVGGNVSGTVITAGSQTNAECATKSK